MRLAKRVRPMLGVAFGSKAYVLAVLKDVEDEVHRSATLRFKFPWFDEQVLAEERLAARMRLTSEEKASIDVAAGVLRASVLADPLRFMGGGGSPPSPVDCRVLAHGYVRECIVATDDLSMHKLASEFDIRVWHGYELLKALLNAKAVDTALVKEIYDALEANGDLPASWRAARNIKFSKIFGGAKK
ncbi:hypothetical protein MNR01_14075 [Lysobacter sp. S4-A87]|uniref:hypothetical protein n=1 Tax=Lysobacter sp. S4-A87 TaxID=2925843 RepID=UPI001F53AF5F|nr:hypothetical protein [Lysobacter sp. S4-A87]UNK48856.1 hypothetical protein MNR01_14075 [Lysobacter sp. S4-A87]